MNSLSVRCFDWNGASVIRLLPRRALSGEKPKTAPKQRCFYSSSLYLQQSHNLKSCYKSSFVRRFTTHSSGNAAKSSKSNLTKEAHVQPSNINFITSNLTQMFKMDPHVNRNDLRLAVKQFKNLESKEIANVLQTLSKRIISSSPVSETSESTKTSSPVSKLGEKGEESLARLLETSVDASKMSSMFYQLSEQYPEWLDDGWENVVERLLINKGYDVDYLTFILSCLPRSKKYDFSIALKKSDLVVKYESKWSQYDKTSSSVLETNNKWRSISYGRIIAKFFQQTKDFEIAASLIAYLALNHWNKDSTCSAGEAFVSSVFFASVVFASFVQFTQKMSNQQIASMLKILNSKIIDYLKRQKDIVNQAFNTYEYLEWVSMTVAEVSKRKESKFHDVILIKKLLDEVLHEWESDEIQLVSNNISSRFSVRQWIKESIEEWKAPKQNQKEAKSNK